jgi:AcrR family transcriptional regulator
MQAATTTRRTQQERRASTRRALLDATVACLCELGHARTTTTEVVRRAGVSQGALFKHFATRAELVAAAAAALFDALFVEFEAAFAAAARAPQDDRIVAAVRALHRVFESPKLRAVYALYVEAASDPELRAALEPVVVRHGERVRHTATALFPAIRPGTVPGRAFAVLLLALQGLTLQKPVHVDPREEADLLATFEQVARLLLGDDGGTPCT